MERFELIAERGLLEPDAEVLVEDKDAFLGLLEKEANDFDKEENIELLLVGVPGRDPLVLLLRRLLSLSSFSTKLSAIILFRLTRFCFKFSRLFDTPELIKLPLGTNMYRPYDLNMDNIKVRVEVRHNKSLVVVS